MKKEDLIHGEIYRQNRASQSYIFFLNKNAGYVSFSSKGFINLQENSFIKYEGNSGDNFNTIVEASELEKAWLLECVKQGKFIPLEDIKIQNNYNLWEI